MDHIAILAKKRKLLDKIVSGEKTIESRWYKFKKTPFQNIKAGETVYFKDSGEPVTAKAIVKEAMFFDGLDETKIRGIIDRFGQKICMTQEDAPGLVGKRFCTLIFLEKVEKIEPFEIDKKGFGMMAAWISVDDINQIKKIV